MKFEYPHGYLDGRVRVQVADITATAVDAIVNAANSSLLGGGGVDGAIHRVGGPAILAACRELRRTRFPNGLAAGDAVMTPAGDLPARFVIHTVGPVWGQDPAEDRLLASCYRRCIALAQAAGLQTLAFPAISTGAYGYPRAQAADVASRTLTSALADAPSIQCVLLVFFTKADAELFAKHQQFPVG